MNRKGESEHSLFRWAYFAVQSFAIGGRLEPFANVVIDEDLTSLV
jgi:hypothetical protein